MSDTFRAEVRAWLDACAPPALHHTASSPFQGYWGGRGAAFETDDHRRWFEAALARGWTAPTWPTRYGGGGLSAAEGQILGEELDRLGMPRPLVGFGLVMLGPVLLRYGSEAQRSEHLPAIVRGEVRWCQGYSEPGSGSDLASLQTRAVREGEHYVVNGQKIWTSFADRSDWIFCLVRTSTAGRKHAGITFLLIDMTSPGITTRPIALISGSSPFCETFFTEVRVPVENAVGEPGGGWRIATSLLSHERTAIGSAIVGGGARPAILHDFSLPQHAQERVGVDEAGRIVDPLIRDAVTRCEMDRAAARLTLQRIRDQQASGHPGPESSIIKVFGTELNQRSWDLAVEILGIDGLLWQSSDPCAEALPRTWLRSLGNSIEGGTTEVQLNIIATRVLGLPRAPRAKTRP